MAANRAVIRMTLDDQRYVAVPEADWAETLARAAGVTLPAYPAAKADGNRPAVAFGRVSIAREVITRRLAAGWSQDVLAKRAGVRVETISRLESAKHAPQAATLEKLEKAFKKFGV